MSSTTIARGFKVTDADRKLRVGIAAKNLDELKRKTLNKFKVVVAASEPLLRSSQIQFQTSDGTLVHTDDYFQTLQPQTLLVWVRHGERAPTDAELIYRTIREVNDEYLTAGGKVQEFFTEKMKSKVFRLAEVLRGVGDGDGGAKTKLSLRDEHPEWFEGLDTNAKTKEDYMFRRAQDRIRTFYYKTREDLLNRQKVLPKTAAELLHVLLIDLQTKLKLSKYHGDYFDRRKYDEANIMKTSSSSSSNNCSSMCNNVGDFVCQGRWDKMHCLYNPMHTINPYSSREGRIIFQTWNLDHGTERSRAIIPAICDALVLLTQTKKKTNNNNNNVDNKLSSSLNNDDDDDNIINNGSKKDYIKYLDVKTIYNDLFTVKNLKLVHIVCHDKGAHTKKKAGPYLLSLY